MEKLKALKDKAVYLAEQGINQDISCINAKELGEVIDIVKDLTEAEYYCSIVKAMENADESEKYMSKYLPEMSYARNYTPHYYDYMKMPEYPDRYYTSKSMIRPTKRMYSDGEEYHHDWDGKAWEYRRNYMSDKMDKKSDESMHDLEEYSKHLMNDVLEIVENATPQEKAILKQKITTLASKIV